jgi:hypothetical protein
VTNGPTLPDEDNSRSGATQYVVSRRRPEFVRYTYRAPIHSSVVPTGELGFPKRSPLRMITGTDWHRVIVLIVLRASASAFCERLGLPAKADARIRKYGLQRHPSSGRDNVSAQTSRRRTVAPRRVDHVLEIIGPLLTGYHMLSNGLSLSSSLPSRYWRMSGAASSASRIGYCHTERKDRIDEAVSVPETYESLCRRTPHLVE